MEIVRLGQNIEKKLKLAAEVIQSGGLVVYPTDTLYGLACDALNKEAIARVFKVKKRPISNPLPIAVNDLKMLEKYAFVDERAEKIAKRFLPGALTIILKKKALPDILTSGLDSIAIRIPDNKTALKLIGYSGVPITTTSANISGKEPPISVEEVIEQIKDIDVILDYGGLESRLPSTILDLTGKPKILREGKIPKAEVMRALEEVYDRNLQKGRKNSSRGHGRGHKAD
jgi:L-threonylcarbamoyladenylate synthase